MTPPPPPRQQRSRVDLTVWQPKPMMAAGRQFLGAGRQLLIAP